MSKEKIILLIKELFNKKPLIKINLELKLSRDQEISIIDKILSDPVSLKNIWPLNTMKPNLFLKPMTK